MCSKLTIKTPEDAIAALFKNFDQILTHLLIQINLINDKYLS